MREAGRKGRERERERGGRREKGKREREGKEKEIIIHPDIMGLLSHLESSWSSSSSSSSSSSVSSPFAKSVSSKRFDFAGGT